MSEAILTLLGNKASEELKNLLENKHLYQSVPIDVGNIVKEVIGAEARPNHKVWLGQWVKNELPKQKFTLSDRPLGRKPGALEFYLTLVVPHVALYCGKCRRREAFAPIICRDVVAEMLEAAAAPPHKKQINLPIDHQMFLFVYQCQRCLGTPEHFLVRRTGWKFALHGRSPIELVEVPNYIPETESWLYRDAVIAFNTGKILAALFYLRTFIEQFARRVTGKANIRATGDEILDAYYETLPQNVKSLMPSLREQYDLLSDAVHAARQDADLFEAAKIETERHFEIRKVHRIAEPKLEAARKESADQKDS